MQPVLFWFDFSETWYDIARIQGYHSMIVNEFWGYLERKGLSTDLAETQHLWRLLWEFWVNKFVDKSWDELFFQKPVSSGFWKIFSLDFYRIHLRCSTLTRFWWNFVELSSFERNKTIQFLNKLGLIEAKLEAMEFREFLW